MPRTKAVSIKAAPQKPVKVSKTVSREEFDALKTRLDNLVASARRHGMNFEPIVPVEALTGKRAKAVDTTTQAIAAQGGRRNALNQNPSSVDGPSPNGLAHPTHEERGDAVPKPGNKTTDVPNTGNKTTAKKTARKTAKK